MFKLSAFRVYILLLVLSFLILACQIPAGSNAGGSKTDISSIFADKFTVVSNPYGINPLASVVIVKGLSQESVETVSISISAMGADKFEYKIDPHSEKYYRLYDSNDVRLDLDGLHIPVIGLASDIENTVAIRISLSGDRVIGKDIQITPLVKSSTNDQLGGGFPEISITKPRKIQDSRWTQVDFTLGDRGVYRYRPFIFDSSGAIRWLFVMDNLGDGGSVTLIHSLNGNYLLSRFGFVYEYNILGRLLHTWSLPGYSSHHELVEIANGPHRGNLIVAVDKIGRSTVEDCVVEIDRVSGLVLREWDMTKILDVNRGSLVAVTADWFHMNGIVYDSLDDSLVISGRNQGVVKVDGSNKLIWILAPHKGWSAPYNGFLLTATNASGVTPLDDTIQIGTAGYSDGLYSFDWAWGQHAPELLPNGDVLLFDNGFLRNFNTSASSGLFSRAVVYRINQQNLSLSQIWEYGRERGSTYQAGFISDVDITPSNTVLVAPGFTVGLAGQNSSFVTEVSWTNEVIFEAKLTFQNRFGSGVSGGWGQMDISYRAEFMSLF